MSKQIVVKIFEGNFNRIKSPETMQEIFAFEGDIVANDGYHTFEELYNHRITLFIALCSEIKAFMELAQEIGIEPEKVTKIWRSKLNGDGTTWDGQFVMGINKEEGKQITYHLPLDRWEETEFAETLDQAPAFDGHTSEDVINRLKDIYTPISQVGKDQANL